MTIAIAATFFSGKIENFQLLVPLMLGGAVIGAVLAKRVEMTSMPELVAILHVLSAWLQCSLEWPVSLIPVMIYWKE